MEHKQAPAPTGGDVETRDNGRTDSAEAERVSQESPAVDVTTEQPTRQELQATVEDGPAENEKKEGSPMADDPPLKGDVILSDERTEREGTSAPREMDAAETGLEKVPGMRENDGTDLATPHASARDEGMTPVQRDQATALPGVQPSPEARAEQVPAEESAPLGQPLGVELQMGQQQPLSQPMPQASQQAQTREVQTPSQQADQQAAQQALPAQPMEQQQSDQSEHPPIPIEHTRQPYSSQPSNARFGPAAASEGAGQRQTQAGAAAAARGMPMFTSGHPPFLRSLPLKRLQNYTKAYGLNTTGAIEKEDFVQTIVKAKNPVTGCLPPDAESYYRRRSVPKQGVMPTPPAPSPRPPQARPGGQPSAQRQQQYRPTYGSQSSPRASPAPGYRPGYMPSPQPVRPPAASFAPRAATTSAPRPKASPQPRPPSPPVPSILSLVALPQSYIASLSIGTLKAILYENHVKVDFSQVLEKTELVRRVQMLVAEERKRLERQRAAEEAEEAEERGAAGRVSVDGEPVGRTDSPDLTAGGDAIPVPTGPKASVERDGLCVVCQDQEAVFANIDCGHLCMCPDCSKLVMATTRECPMCRTRIVTEQRLIRIFRT
ncbi:hypothetical protein QFC20_006241 [Naganishia adeliensis]|uniref:Uncharacterized protein n=1 Tax=Naganishia adeliensis TaxID=92952 RepID=A0ACC2VD69_9TREE|nr:hypothetical protein QFC20_006241 [Naganishia adeliensis]